METTIKEHVYRVKKMNAIEFLAVQTQIDFEDYKSTMSSYNLILEKLEVQLKDKWLPVKAEGQEIYYPANVENELDTIQELIKFFMKEFKSVFQKSNESKEAHE